MKRSLIAVLLLAGLFCTVSAKETLTVAIYPSLDKAYVPLSSNFTKLNPDIDIKFKITGFSDHHNALQAALAAGTGIPDVAAVEISFIGQLGAGGGFDNLLNAPYNAGIYKTNLVPFAWAQASVDAKTLIGIPVDIGPACSFWRVDILTKNGFDYTKLTCMDDIIDAGKKLTKSTDGTKKVNQWMISDAGTIFNTIIRSDATRYFDAKGKPVVNRPLVKTAATWAKKCYDAGITAQIGAWSAEWYAALSSTNGGIVFSPNGAWLEAQLGSWMASQLTNCYRVANLPSLTKGGKPLYASEGGSFLVIPTKTKRKAAAWKFVQYLAFQTQSQLDSFKYAAAFPTWLPAWKDPSFLQPVPYLGGQDARKLWMNIAKKIPSVYINEKDSVAQMILGNYVNEIILNHKDIDKSLAAAQKEVEAQLE